MSLFSHKLDNKTPSSISGMTEKQIFNEMSPEFQKIYLESGGSRK